MGNNDNPRWYHIIAFAVLLLLAGYIISSCSALLTQTARADDTADIHYLINAYRVSQGLQPFLVDNRLTAASETHNLYMRDNDCFSHQCPGEADPWQRIRDAGYPSPASEVIGRGYGDAAAVLDGWQHSSGHNAILLGNWRDMGCHALREGVGGPWWTCDFGTAGQGSVPPPTVTLGPPTPLPTLDSRGPLPAGWLMRIYLPDSSLPPCSLLGVACYRLIEIDYDTSTWAVTDGLFAQYCARGYRCEWQHKPPRQRGTGTEIGEGWTGLPTGVPTVVAGD